MKIRSLNGKLNKQDIHIHWFFFFYIYVFNIFIQGFFSFLDAYLSGFMNSEKGLASCSNSQKNYLLAEVTLVRMLDN